MLETFFTAAERAALRPIQIRAIPAKAIRKRLPGSGVVVRNSFGPRLVKPRMSKVRSAGGSIRTPVRNTCRRFHR